MLSGARREPDPPCHEDAEYVSVCKQSDIAVNSADPGDDSIHPRTHLLWHFAARATVAENQPVGRLLVDLLGRQSLVFAVVPFGQLGVDDGCVAETRQLSRSLVARRIGLTKTRANASLASTGRNLSAIRRKNRPTWPKGRALAADDRLTVRDGLSVHAPLEDHLAMLLKGVQARLQSMKHRDGAIGLLSILNQLVNDPFLPSNTILGQSRCVARPGQGSPAYRCRAWWKMP